MTFSYSSHAVEIFIITVPQKIVYVKIKVYLRVNQNAYVTTILKVVSRMKGFSRSRQSRTMNSRNILEMVQKRDDVTTDH